MSDLFDNLVKRNAGSTEMLRPKLPSMFESPESAVGPPPADIVVEDQEQETAAVRVPERPRNEPQEDAAPKVQVRKHLTREGPEEPSADPSPRPPLSPQPVNAVPPPRPPGEETRTRRNEPEAVRPSLPEPVYPLRETQTSREVHPVSADNSAQPGSRRLTPDPPAVEQFVRERRQEFIPPLRAETRAPQEVPERFSTIKPPLTPRAEARQLLDVPSLGAKEPTIHVTIGRVEVRASLPAASSGKERSTAPAVMPLEEYLRSRRGRDAV